MKKGLYAGIILVMLIVFSVVVAATSAFAWNQSFHAYVAKECLGLEYRYIASYNARMGSLVPDFFWYLRDKHPNFQGVAEILHGPTEQPCVIEFPNDTQPGETTFFYRIAKDALESEPWINRIRLYYFVEGIATHVYADIVAHNTVDGYLEGLDKWIDTLIGSVDNEDKVKDRIIFHLVLEFAVDALLVKHGLILNDLLFCYRQANFLEKVVEDNIGYPGFDVSEEFRKYLTLMRALEKAAYLYAPYLIKGEVDEGALVVLESSELMEVLPQLSEEGFEIYLEVLMILLKYPAEIYATLTIDEMHWEYDALPAAIDFCSAPVFCE